MHSTYEIETGDCQTYKILFFRSGQGETLAAEDFKRVFALRTQILGSASLKNELLNN